MAKKILTAEKLNENFDQTGAEFNYFVKELKKLVVNKPIPFLYYDTSAIPKYSPKISFLSISLGFV